MTHTYAELEVTEPTYNEIAQKLKAAGYDHAFMPEKGQRDTIDMHGIGLTCKPKMLLLRLVGTDADDRVQHAADVVYQLAVTHMTAGLRVANRLRKEAGMPELTADDVIGLLGLLEE